MNLKSGVHAGGRINLKSGVHKFRTDVYPANKDLFEKLSQGQSPETLFIACSDSRVDPALITQTQPGDLFVVRNPGNIVPPSGSTVSGEAAAIDFAVSVVGVRNIVVCGHIGCAAVRACCCPESQVPASLTDWLKYAQSTRDKMLEKHPHLTVTHLPEYLKMAVHEHVLAQMEHLTTYPIVAEAVAAGKLRIYGWIYDIQTGEIVSHKYRPPGVVAHPATAGTSAAPVQTTR